MKSQKQIKALKAEVEKLKADAAGTASDELLVKLEKACLRPRPRHVSVLVCVRAHDDVGKLGTWRSCQMAKGGRGGWEVGE